ncbi:Eco29kI family restriction endonuclease [Roseovarius lutimaris]|uniref:Eco29kI family restriction endonuclease n=1 Tax=Roseovarius lutimaris TaxID=1005928 RepID=UPI000B809EC5
MKKVIPYNPLDKQHLAESAANALLKQEPQSLPPEPFEGAGIYAIYYTGDFEAYRPLAQINRDRLEAPIYVGKAEPKGGRRGGDLDAPSGPALSDRLRKHARSVEQADNLNVVDFRCRYLVLDDVWVRMAERMLISWYRPVWNVVVDGFGNNDPGGRRATQYRSPWDVLHSGRPWVEKLAQGKTSADDVRAKIAEHFQNLK